MAEKATKNEIAIERARINNLATSAASVDNVETLDIRVGANGKTYKNAGEAVRAIGAGEAISDNALSAEKMAFVKIDRSKNFYDATDQSYLKGYYTGTAFSPSAYRTTPLMFLKAGTYAFTGRTTTFGNANAARVVTFTDKTGATIKNIASGTVGAALNAAVYASGNLVTFTLAEDSYVRLNVCNEGAAESHGATFALVVGNTLPESFPVYYKTKTVLSEEIGMPFVDEKKPVNVYKGGFQGGYTSTSGFVGGGTYTATDPFDLEAGTYLYKLFGASNYGSGGGLVVVIDPATGNSNGTVLATKISENLTLNERLYSFSLLKNSRVIINVNGFSNDTAKTNTFMVVKGTKAEDYPTVYQPYFEPYKTFKPGYKLNEAMKDEITSLNASKETINIANASKIGVFSNSFINGYTMKSKHPLNMLGMWSDYIFYNYGHSGDDLLECLGRINRDEKWLGDVPPSQWGLTYAIIAMQDNDGALLAASPDSYYENGKKLAHALMSRGATAILGTEHDVANNYYGFSRLAADLGVMFMNWGRFAHSFKRYNPFWHSGHPATRTHWLWTNGMKTYLDTLPRPRKGLKIFRLRPSTTYSNINELVYNDTKERARLFSELHVGSSVLTSATEKYFDRLQSATAYENILDEYQKLQSGQEITAGNAMLVEVITPYDAKGIRSLLIKHNAKNVSKVYIKKNARLSNPLPDIRTIAFRVTSGAELLAPGTTFNITGGVFSDTLIGTYTVDKIVDGVVSTTTRSSGKVTSGTDAPTTNKAGVVLAGSYDYPSADYLLRYDKPLAEFVEIASADGKINVSNFADFMDFDKVSLLFVGTGITVTNIEAEVSGIGEKINLPKSLVSRKKGSQLLTNPLFSTGDNWGDYNATTAVIPITDGTQTEAFPPEITAVRKMEKGITISQPLKTTEINALSPYETPRLQVRILARYFPKYVLTDADFSTSEIKVDTYDCATMSVKVGNMKIAQTEIGLYWNEYIFETDYFTEGDLKISCESKSFEIAKVECILI